MIIGLTIQKYKNFSPSLYTDIARKAGIEHFEFDPSIFFDIYDIEKLKRLVVGKSVIIHAPYYTDWKYDLSSRSKEDKIEEFMKNLKQFGFEFGVKAIVVHPPVDPNADLHLYYQNIDRIPFPVYLENLPNQPWAVFENWFLGVQNHVKAKIGICFDVPHSIIANGLSNAFEIPASLVSLINYIHISELDGSVDCHWPFFTPDGIFPRRKFVRFLKSMKYSGIINMEIRPVGKKGIINVIRSYFLMYRLLDFPKYLYKIIRFCVMFIPLAITAKKILKIL